MKSYNALIIFSNVKKKLNSSLNILHVPKLMYNLFEISLQTTLIIKESHL